MSIYCLTLNPNVCNPCYWTVVLGDLKKVVNTRSHFFDSIYFLISICSFSLDDDWQVPLFDDLCRLDDKWLVDSESWLSDSRLLVELVLTFNVFEGDIFNILSHDVIHSSILFFFFFLGLYVVFWVSDNNEEWIDTMILVGDISFLLRIIFTIVFYEGEDFLIFYWLSGCLKILVYSLSMSHYIIFHHSYFGTVS